MVQIGQYNTLKVAKQVDFGVYLDGGDDVEILLPKRYVPTGVQDGGEVTVFVYHDNENKLIATTDKPLAVVGDIAMLECVSTTGYGAFLKWGIMKDLLCPISQQEERMAKGNSYLVMLYIDEQTGRVSATQKFSKHLSNHDLTVAENDTVDLLVFQKTDIGYKVIINNKHLGVLHYNEVFRELEIGDKVQGFIKAIRPGSKIDVSIGKRGYSKVEDEETKILRLIQEAGGYLPYHDRSTPEEIYEFFGMSKKVFKMTVGSLYKKRKISLAKTGIQLEGEE